MSTETIWLIRDGNQTCVKEKKNNMQWIKPIHVKKKKKNFYDTPSLVARGTTDDVEWIKQM